jgi:archaellum component FlaC
MFSPIITSTKATLLDIIGEDCFNIIEDYKNEIERYEQNFKDIKECINSENYLKKYNMTIDLSDFRDFYIKNNDNRIEFKIIIDNQIHRIKHNIKDLVPTYLYLLRIESMRYKETLYREKIIELMLGEYKEDEMKQLEKILIKGLFNLDNNLSPSLIYDEDYLNDFFMRYINSNNMEELII